MNSVQESKNELEASIRYAENAISSAKQTIESMEFRQQMAQKNYQEQTGREAALEREVAELKEARDRAEGEVELLQNAVKELESKVQGQYDDIVMLERDLTVKTAQAEAWKKEARGTKATMPVIPKDVAIAIFREGTLFGVEAACDEIEGERITVSETGYTGDFEVSFERSIELDEHIDFDWVRSKIGDYDEDNVTANLQGLCARKNFECRIHGIDDNTIDLTKKND